MASRSPSLLSPSDHRWGIASERVRICFTFDNLFGRCFAWKSSQLATIIVGLKNDDVGRFSPWARGKGTPIYFLYGDVPTVGIIFRVLCLNRVYNFTFSCLNRVFPANLRLFSPFDHTSFADFVRLRWLWVKTQTCVPFLVFLIPPAWFSLEQGKEITALSLRQGGKINIFCVFNRVWFSLSQPNPPTQIPVEYPPPPLPDREHPWPLLYHPSPPLHPSLPQPPPGRGWGKGHLVWLWSTLLLICMAEGFDPSEPNGPYEANLVPRAISTSRERPWEQAWNTSQPNISLLRWRCLWFAC